MDISKRRIRHYVYNFNISISINCDDSDSLSGLVEQLSTALDSSFEEDKLHRWISLRSDSDWKSGIKSIHYGPVMIVRENDFLVGYGDLIVSHYIGIQIINEEFSHIISSQIKDKRWMGIQFKWISQKKEDEPSHPQVVKMIKEGVQPLKHTPRRTAYSFSRPRTATKKTKTTPSSPTISQETVEIHCQPQTLPSSLQEAVQVQSQPSIVEESIQMQSQQQNLLDIVQEPIQIKSQPQSLTISDQEPIQIKSQPQSLSTTAQEPMQIQSQNMSTSTQQTIRSQLKSSIKLSVTKREILCNYWFGENITRMCCVCNRITISRSQQSAGFIAAHVIAHHRGGDDQVLWNRVPSCVSCNNLMGQQNLIEYVAQNYPSRRTRS